MCLSCPRTPVYHLSGPYKGGRDLVLSPAGGLLHDSFVILSRNVVEAKNLASDEARFFSRFAPSE